MFGEYLATDGSVAFKRITFNRTFILNEEGEQRIESEISGAGAYDFSPIVSS